MQLGCNISTNNEAEYHLLNRGLEIAIREGYQRLQIEGDSKLVIDTIKQLQQGVIAEKLRKSWRMAWVITEVEKQLQRLAYTVSSHVKRKGNALVDLLTNWGCQNKEHQLDAGEA